MAAQVSVTSQVQVVFTVTDPDRPDGVSFTDALYYPVGQVPSNAAVRTAALARYQAWRATLDSRPPRPPRAERIRLAVEARDAVAAQVAVAEMALATELGSVDP